MESEITWGDGMEPSGKKARSAFPGILQACVLLVLLVMAQFILGLWFGILDQVLDLSRFLGQPLIIGLINTAAIGLMLVICVAKERPPRRDIFPLARLPALLLLPMGLTVLGLTIVVSEADNLMSLILPMPEGLAALFGDLVWPREGWWRSLLLLMIIAPVTEELLFRGLILRGFLGRYSIRTSVLVSAVLFGLFHLNPWQLFGAVALGILVAWWSVETHSLLPCLLGHAFYNALPLIASALRLDVAGYTAARTDAVLFQPLWLDALGIALTSLGIWLLAKMFARLRHMGRWNGAATHSAVES